MHYSAPKKAFGFVAGISVVVASLVGVSGTASAVSPGPLDPETASISGSISWQAITGGGSETPDPLVTLEATGDTAGGGLYAVVAQQFSTDGTYDFTALAAGSYVVKVTDEANGGGPNSYYPVTFYGGEFDYEDATPITLAAGQASTGNNVLMPVGATVTGTITGVHGTGLPYVEDAMFSTTAAGASLDTSLNDGVDVGTTRVDENKYTNSDSSGTVVIHGVAPGTYAFRYAGDDTYGPDGTEYAPSYWKNATFGLDATTLTTVLGHTYTVNQRLNAASYVTGTLKDDAGTPVRGGYAVLYNTEDTTDDNAGLVHVTEVQPNGSWGFNLIGPGTYRVGFTEAAVKEAEDTDGFVLNILAKTAEVGVDVPLGVFIGLGCAVSAFTGCAQVTFAAGTLIISATGGIEGWVSGEGWAKGSSDALATPTSWLDVITHAGQGDFGG